MALTGAAIVGAVTTAALTAIGLYKRTPSSDFKHSPISPALTVDTETKEALKFPLPPKLAALTDFLREKLSATVREEKTKTLQAMLIKTSPAYSNEQVYQKIKAELKKQDPKNILSVLQKEEEKAHFTRTKNTSAIYHALQNQINLEWDSQQKILAQYADTLEELYIQYETANIKRTELMALFNSAILEAANRYADYCNIALLELTGDARELKKSAFMSTFSSLFADFVIMKYTDELGFSVQSIPQIRKFQKTNILHHSDAISPSVAAKQIANYSLHQALAGLCQNIKTTRSKSNAAQQNKYEQNAAQEALKIIFAKASPLAELKVLNPHPVDGSCTPAKTVEELEEKIDALENQLYHEADYSGHRAKDRALAPHTGSIAYAIKKADVFLKNIDTTTTLIKMAHDELDEQSNVDYMAIEKSVTDFLAVKESECKELSDALANLSSRATSRVEKMRAYDAYLRKSTFFTSGVDDFSKKQVNLMNSTADLQGKYGAIHEERVNTMRLQITAGQKAYNEMMQIHQQFIRDNEEMLETIRREKFVKDVLIFLQKKFSKQYIISCWGGKAAHVGCLFAERLGREKIAIADGVYKIVKQLEGKNVSELPYTDAVRIYNQIKIDIDARGGSKWNRKKVIAQSYEALQTLLPKNNSDLTAEKIEKFKSRFHAIMEEEAHASGLALARSTSFMGR